MEKEKCKQHQLQGSQTPFTNQRAKQHDPLDPMYSGKQSNMKPANEPIIFTFPAPTKRMNHRDEPSKHLNQKKMRFDLHK